MSLTVNFTNQAVALKSRNNSVQVTPHNGAKSQQSSDVFRRNKDSQVKFGSSIPVVGKLAIGAGGLAGITYCLGLEKVSFGLSTIAVGLFGASAVKKGCLSPIMKKLQGITNLLKAKG